MSESSDSAIYISLAADVEMNKWNMADRYKINSYDPSLLILQWIGYLSTENNPIIGFMWSSFAAPCNTTKL